MVVVAGQITGILDCASQERRIASSTVVTEGKVVRSRTEWINAIILGRIGSS
jgi:hypothetical protein